MPVSPLEARPELTTAERSRLRELLGSETFAIALRLWDWQKRLLQHVCCTDRERANYAYNQGRYAGFNLAGSLLEQAAIEPAAAETSSAEIEPDFQSFFHASRHAGGTSYDE